jgi:hypothetical protein
MANTNNNKTLNVPNLRFPEFKGEWKKSTLKRYTKKITHKNKTKHNNQCPMQFCRFRDYPAKRIF